MKLKCVLVDIDGTIADITHRVPHVNNSAGTKDWGAFNKAMHLDVPKQGIIDIIKAIHDTGVKVFMVTGRFNQYRAVTMEWLDKYDVPCDALHMRPDGDYTSDHLVKKKILRQQILPEFDVMAVFDDRQSVVDMWREEGIICLQVQKGDY